MEVNNDNEYEVGFVLASPLERFLAILIDGLIVTAISLTGVGSILGIAYLLVKDSLPIFDGQSIGKKAMKIKVLDDDKNVSIKNNYEKGLIRNITLLIPVFQFIDAFMVFSANRKRFGDQWAKTMVVKAI